MTTEPQLKSSRRWSPRTVIAFIGFVAVAAFYLWTDHRVHVLAAVPFLPYLIFLACPLMHIFMHHGHGGRNGQHDQTASPDAKSHDHETKGVRHEQ